MNKNFQDALKGNNSSTPPVWFMRQAGRYHSHYQNLRKDNSFMNLCKNPDLAAEVALGPIQDFDFDVSILFSDLLFPLEALGMGLEYTDHGPRLGWQLRPDNIKDLKKPEDALEALMFQKQAVQATRAVLPKNKSLVGFVGGPWTLFVYATEGSHAGGLALSKAQLPIYQDYLKIMVPLLKENIRIQLEGGAEIIYLFDTAAGELSPMMFQAFIEPALLELNKAFPGKLAYYSKATHPDHFSPSFLSAAWAGVGFDHRVVMPKLLAEKKSKYNIQGVVQGNFDQTLLLADTKLFEKEFYNYIQPYLDLPAEARKYWVSGLGHGVLPKTPEKHVRFFVEQFRKSFS